MINLVSSSNNDGYQSALRRSWHQTGRTAAETPVKSSFGKAREKISSDFFRDIYLLDLKRQKRRTYRGMYIYAVDGDILDLPASEDILKVGYRGTPFSKSEETHYPKMYTVQILDLLSGEIRGFSYSSQIGERRLAWPMISSYEKNSITIYDRLFDCYKTASLHEKAGNYFFVRVKSKNPSAFKEIKEFCSSKQRSTWITIRPVWKTESKPPIKLRLIKVKNKGKDDIVFMTNAPEGLISNRDAASFYLRRWGIEGSFRDLTDTLKMCQWHSRKINGILQEIYTTLWLVNQVRRLLSWAVKRPRSWLNPGYEKANFKAAMLTLADNFQLLFSGKSQKLLETMVYWATKSIERRRHLSRSYPRQLKRFGKKYKNASRAGRRPTAAA